MPSWYGERARAAATKARDSRNAAPGGVTVDSGGTIFVTTLTFGPPGGSVLSLNG